MNSPSSRVVRPQQTKDHPISRRQERFSILRFSILSLLQFAAFGVGFRLLLPGLWARQFAAGVPALILTFLIAHMGLCFFEWAFHRYVLHSMVIPVLGWFTRGHRSHHGLTPIKLQAAAAGSDRYVLNRYPITEEEQHVDSAFPWYSILGFWAFFTPLLLVIQWLLPHAPVLMGSYAAIAFSMVLYEILHALEHYPYEWWKRATEHPRFGTFWRKLYGFHHMHHANISCNEAISGFFGLPIADWLFGTYHQPKELLLEGRVATARDFAVSPPPRWVQWLDAWARRREATIHHGKI